jgi:hypothetical protein
MKGVGRELRLRIGRFGSKWFGRILGSQDYNVNLPVEVSEVSIICRCFGSARIDIVLPCQSNVCIQIMPITMIFY